MLLMQVESRDASLGRSQPNHKQANSGVKAPHFYLKTELQSSQPVAVLVQQSCLLIAYPTSITIVDQEWRVLQRMPVFGQICDACVACRRLWIITDVSMLVAYEFSDVYGMRMVLNKPIHDRTLHFLTPDTQCSSFLICSLQGSVFYATVESLPVPAVAPKEFLYELSDGQSYALILPLNLGRACRLLRSCFIGSQKFVTVVQDGESVELIPFYFDGSTPGVSSHRLPTKIPIELKPGGLDAALLAFEDEILLMDVEKEDKQVLLSLEDTKDADGRPVLVAACSELVNGQYVFALTSDGALKAMDIHRTEAEDSTVTHEVQTDRSEGMLVVVSTADAPRQELLLASRTGDFLLFSFDASTGFEQIREAFLGSLANWAPVMDFKLADIPREKQDLLYVTSGFRQSGSLREVRKGINAEVLAQSAGDYSRLRSMWAGKDDLILSFSNGSRSLSLLQDAPLVDTTQSSSINPSVSTLWAGQLDGHLVQVHSGGITSSQRTIRFKKPAHMAAVVMGGIVTASSETPYAKFLFWDSGYAEPRWEFHGVRESSCLHGSRVGARDILLIGTYRPSLLVYELGDHPKPSLVTERLIGNMIDVPFRC